MQTTAATQPEIIYPETDGEPMAQNTQQAEVMMTLKENLDALFADRDDVFVAIDHFWYPVKGHPEIRQAPDVMVVLGCPKRHRGSYKQWEEEDIPPQVVFEVVSPSNTRGEWDAKLAFYEQYGVLEYYIYDPERVSGAGMCVRVGSWQRLVRWRVGSVRCWAFGLVWVRVWILGCMRRVGSVLWGMWRCVVRWRRRWRGSWRRVGARSNSPRNCVSWV